MDPKKGKIDEIGHTSTGDSRRALICAASYPDNPTPGRDARNDKATTTAL